MKIEIDPLVEKISRAVKAHERCAGGYVRMTDGDKLNEYGCSDALNIRYTIDEMPSGRERQAFVSVLQEFQKPDSGLYREGSHPDFHCTAHCIASLELLDEMPLYPVTAMNHLRKPEAVADWLSSLSFIDTKGSGHIGAGVFATFYNTKTMSVAWQNAFFDWLDEHNDPESGISIKGAYTAGFSPCWLHMGDWFHFLFCYTAARRAYPHPERVVDSCLEMVRNHRMPDSFGKGSRFLDIDWSFTLNRASIQSGYRLDESRAELRKFAQGYIDYLMKSDLNEIQWRDIHLMFGAVCALSELQQALPGEIRSERCLRQVLDRRPFI